MTDPINRRALLTLIPATCAAPALAAPATDWRPETNLTPQNCVSAHLREAMAIMKDTAPTGMRLNSFAYVDGGKTPVLVCNAFPQGWTNGRPYAEFLIGSGWEVAQ